MAKHESAQVDQHVGQRLRMRRLALEKSQEWLARSVGLTFQQVQKYVKGTNRVSASRLQQFANLLNVPVSYFFEDNPSNQKTGKLDPDMAAMQRFMASSHGVAIARAFGKIESSVLRARLVDLIEALT